MRYGLDLKKKKMEILKYVIPWINLENIMLNEVSLSQGTDIAQFYLNEVSKIVKLREAENGMLVTGGLGDEERTVNQQI